MSALAYSVFIAFLLTVVFTITASATTGSVGGRPTNPDPKNARSSSIFIYTLDKTESRSDSVTLINNTDSTQEVRLYAVDATTSNTGAFTCKQDVESRDNVGRWITFEKKTVELAANSRQDVSFEVSIPEDTDVGEHNGCVVIQPEDNESDAANGNVRIRTRSAIRVAVTVPGDLKRDVTIESFSVANNNQDYLLSLKNIGNVSADIQTKVYLRTLFGSSVFENGGDYPIIANKSLELRFSNDSLPYWGGFYVVAADISYDKQAGSFGTTGQGGTVKKYADGKIVFVTPQPGAAMLYLLLVAGVVTGGYLLIARRVSFRTWKTYTVKEGDSIESIAKKQHTGWKKIARANSIKAPYALDAGREIKIPSRKKKA